MLTIIHFMILDFSERSLKSLYNFQNPRYRYKVETFSSENLKSKHDKIKTSL